MLLVLPKIALIHIGTRKTGTTSIQEALANAGRHLGTVGYPLVGSDRDQNRIISLYLAHDELPITWKDLDPSLNRCFNRVFFEQLNLRREVVISAEALSAWFQPASIRRLRLDFEKAGFSRFCIVLYIRDPADYYLSYTQQMLKSTFDCAPAGEHPGIFRYQFRRIAETWEEIFPGNLIVRKYPSCADGDVVRDFADILRDKLGVSVPIHDYRVNKSLSAEGMKILQDYRLQFPDVRGPGILTADAAKLVAFLHGSRESIEQTKPVLRPEIAEGIRANHREDAEYIYSKYGVDIRSPGVSSENFNLDRSYRVSDLVELCDVGVIQRILQLMTRSCLQEQEERRSLLDRVKVGIYRKMKYLW